MSLKAPRMLGEVIEAAAELAGNADPSVDSALEHYDGLPDPLDYHAQLWVSVAFLLAKHARIAAGLDAD